MKPLFALLLVLISLLGCETTPVKPYEAGDAKAWKTAPEPPERWLVIELTVSPSRLPALLEALSPGGITFPKARGGFLRSDPAVDLAIFLTGKKPVDFKKPLSAASTVEEWAMEMKSAFLVNALVPLRVELWGAESENNAVHALVNLGVNVVHHPVVAAPLEALNRKLEERGSESWQLCFFALDTRLIESNVFWERELVSALSRATTSSRTGIILVTRPPGISEPAPKIAFNGLQETRGGVIHQFYLKQEDLSKRARLASVLKKSLRYESIFSKQITGGRAHYIATHSGPAKITEGQTEVPAVVSHLENTFGVAGPDILAVPSLERYAAQTNPPLFFWSPTLKESPVISDGEPTWFSIAPFLQLALGAQKASSSQDDPFTPWLLRN